MNMAIMSRIWHSLSRDLQFGKLFLRCIVVGFLPAAVNLSVLIMNWSLWYVAMGERNRIAC